MSKRNVGLVLIALVMALSALAFVALPATSAPVETDAASSVDGMGIATLYTANNVGLDFNPPEVCPMPDSPGCGGS